MMNTLKRRVDKLQGNITPELSNEELEKLSGPDLILYFLNQGYTLQELIEASMKLEVDEQKELQSDVK
jgi:hypothetical protein